MSLLNPCTSPFGVLGNWNAWRHFGQFDFFFLKKYLTYFQREKSEMLATFLTAVVIDSKSKEFNFNSPGKIKIEFQTVSNTYTLLCQTNFRLHEKIAKYFNLEKSVVFERRRKWIAWTSPNWYGWSYSSQGSPLKYHPWIGQTSQVLVQEPWYENIPVRVLV